MSLADLFSSPVSAVRTALRDAVAAVDEVPVERDAALIAALAARLREPRLPALVHYFHGTRLLDPERIRTHGLLPHNRVLDTLWQQLGALMAAGRSLR